MTEVRRCPLCTNTETTERTYTRNGVSYVMKFFTCVHQIPDEHETSNRPGTILPSFVSLGWHKGKPVTTR